MIGSVNTPRGRNILFLEGVMKDKEDKLIATATARIYGWTKEPETMFELVERDAWLDLFAAARDDCAQHFGISSRRLGDMGLLASREIAIVEFNRAMCVGIVSPATETELDEASAWLQANAAAGWALQVAPAAQDECGPRLAAPPRPDGLGDGLGEV